MRRQYTAHRNRNICDLVKLFPQIFLKLVRVDRTLILTRWMSRYLKNLKLLIMINKYGCEKSRPHAFSGS